MAWQVLVRYALLPRHRVSCGLQTYTALQVPENERTVGNWGGPDWDASLLVDVKENFTETLYALELANLQLVELEAYDRILDDSLDRAYRDLAAVRSMRGNGSTLRELREIRIDLARASDELMNFTKFFGDFHIARIYETVAKRFHLSDWHRTVDDKLKTLDNLYQMLATDRNTRWMLILEIAIVLLFIIDVGILLRPCGLKPRPTRILMKTTSVPEKFATLTLTADVLIPDDAKPVLSADGKITGF